MYMKSISLTLLGLCSLTTAPLFASFPEAMQRVASEKPEFVFYADLENDFAAAGAFLTEAYLAYLSTGPDIPPIPIDAGRLFGHLGLLNLSDFLVVSEPRPGKGFINQMLTTFDGAPKGLFLLGGDANQPFAIIDSAPADAHLVAEMHLNGVALFQIVRNIVIDIMGPLGQGLIEAQMNQPLTPDGPTLADLINRLTTRIQIALKPELSPTIPLPSHLALLQGHSVVRLSNVADLLDQFAPTLQAAGLAPRESSTGAKAWSLAMPAGPVPVTLYLDTLPGSNDLVLSLNPASVEWMRQPEETIGESAAFRETIAGLPVNGLSFWYATEEMGRLQIESLDLQLAENPAAAPVIAAVKRLLLNYTGAQAGVSVLEEDAYRVISYQPASYKTNLALAGAVVPLGILSGVLQNAQEIQETTQPDEPADE